MKTLKKVFILLLLLGSYSLYSQTKPRIINTTDIGGDPDDEQSMVRFLVQSNEFDVEGLIVATGCWNKNQSSTEILDKIVTAYGQALSNLRVHNPDYPSLEYLRSVSVLGQQNYGMDDVGSGKDSPGSELIISAVDKNDPRPVWVTFWGGGNTLAQALWKVQNTRTQAEVNEFVSKIRVYDVLGQGDAGTWIAKNFPDLIYIRATSVYDWQPSTSWVDQNVQSHGALGAVYPDRIYAMEGDTPAFLHVLSNGLNNPDEPWQGGWGGRFGRNKKSGIRGMSCMSGEDAPYDPYYMYGNEAGVNEWQPAINNDFQARMDWSINSNYSSANHHPIVVLNGDQTRDVLVENVKPGSSFNLSATGTTDPDGNSLTYKWFYYQDAGTYSGSVSVNSTAVTQTIQIPSDAAEKEIHIVLEVHDNGSPNLYMYRRVVFKVTNTLPIDVNITSPANGAEFEIGDVIDIAATAQSDQGSITQVEFFVDGTSIGIDNTAPYTATYTASGGSHVLSAIAKDNQGGEGSGAVTIFVYFSQEPYGGTPHAIPGTIEFEHYDICGNNCAYYDDSPGTDVPEAPDFRTDEDVDIENCTDDGGGYNIGYFTAGEWLEYTVNVASAGAYDMILRVACNGDGRTISLGYENGTAITGNISIPNTTGWQTWTDVTVKDIHLNTGNQVFRFTCGSTDYINLNKVTFTATNIIDNDNDGVPAGTDCDDNDPNIGAATTWYADIDNDGAGDPNTSIVACDQPTGYLNVAGDNCPEDPNKTEPGVCGCGIPEGTCASTAIWLEAECGTVGSMFEQLSDANASNDKYVTVQSGNNSLDSAPTSSSGQISFTFSVSEEGSYILWARVIAPTDNDDSFWIQVNGGDWLLWNNIGPNSSWAWEQANSYSLSAGTHTIVVAYREDGAQLDKLYITNSGDTPSGEGEVAGNCGITPVTYTLSTSVNGSGTVSGAGTYNEGASVTVTATPSSGYVFDSWSGDASGTNNSVTIIMDGDKSVTATFVVDNSDTIACDTETPVSMPFSQDGTGEYCFVATGTLNYVNSWSMDLVEINGKDVTNTWSNDIPDASDGKIHIHYVASVAWAHFEINGEDGQVDPDRANIISGSISGANTVSSSGTYTVGTSIKIVTDNKYAIDCDTEAPVSMPFSQDGAGEYCFVATGTLNYVNSWNMDLVEINGKDVTNTWSNDIPDASDGKIHIHYVASVAWAHFEINGEDGQVDPDPTTYTITTSVTGSGTVSGGGTYTSGSTASLTATPSSGYTFSNWSGDITGTDASVTVTVNSNMNVTANFVENTNGAVISVRAKGTDGSETLELEIDGVVMITWTMSTLYQVFTYTGSETGVFRLNFTNDGEGKDIQVDYLEVSGTTYQAEDQAVNTALYANGECGGGSHSEMMHCNGYIQFNVGGECADSDGDGVDDCNDKCPNDPNKTEPGECGCGVEEGTCEGFQFAIAGGNQGIAACKAKFVGNILPSWTSPMIRSDFSTYWNQVTPENAGKWGVVEGSRNSYNWSDLDEMYNYCQQNGLPFKQHVFIWGNQQPSWLSGLSESDQRNEVEQWFSLFAQRYPNTRIIDVVNESLPGHASTVAVKEALGGANNGASISYLSSHPEYGPYGTGWDYIIYAFAKAREYFPNAILVLNDYNIINSSSNINAHLQIANILKQRGLIDAIGIQAHAFSVDDMSASQITSGLDQLASAGLPIHVTELDIRGNTEEQQRDRYATIFPAFYEHPAVAGITLWGYVEGTTWLDNTGILNSDGSERLAIQWLKEYMALQSDVCRSPKDSDVAVGKDHFSDLQILVYPNPLKDAFKIELVGEFEENVTITLCNSLGQVVLTDRITSLEQSFDVEGLKAGTYFMIVNGNAINFTQKIVKVE